MDRENILFSGFFLFVAFYMVFHIGRFYEKQQIHRQISQTVVQESFVTDYIIPHYSEAYADEFGYGRCFTSNGTKFLDNFTSLISVVE